MKKAVNPFEHHAPSEAEIARIERLRAAFAAVLAEVDLYTCPGSSSGRYVALAKTALEEACQWAVKSVVFERHNDAS